MPPPMMRTGTLVSEDMMGVFLMSKVQKGRRLLSDFRHTTERDHASLVCRKSESSLSQTLISWRIRLGLS